jgi:apolipoprotein N-acyltransferase
MPSHPGQARALSSRDPMAASPRLAFPGWRAVGLAFGLGLIAATGQAPLGWWFLSLPALAVLISVMAGGDARRAAWLGWFGGAGYFGAALNWIISPFLVDAATHGWMAPFALVLMAFGMALFWALACGLGMRARRPILGLVAALATAELARGYVLTGFPWALLGHVWIDLPPAQLAALIGPSGLTLLTLAMAGLAATGGSPASPPPLQPSPRSGASACGNWPSPRRPPPA